MWNIGRSVHKIQGKKSIENVSTTENIFIEILIEEMKSVVLSDK